MVHFDKKLIFGMPMLAGLWLGSPAFAADWVIPGGVGVGVALEYVSWEEHPTPSTSKVVETGPRASIRASFDNLTRQGNGLLYRLEGKLYRGTVDFEGTLQNSIGVFQTTTDQTGNYLEFSGGFRLDGQAGGFALDVMAGLGRESFSRDVSDGVTTAAPPVPAPGVTQDFSILYTKVGGAVSEQRGSWRGMLRAGVKLPFSIDEDVDLLRGGFSNDVTLSPKETQSYFAELEFKNLPASGGLKWGFSLYYDSYRFDPSSPQLATKSGLPVSVLQLQTDLDIYGISLAYYY